jgi:hypothetical protein
MTKKAKYPVAEPLCRIQVPYVRGFIYRADVSANYQLVITYRLELHLGHVRYVMYYLSLNHCGFDTSMP